MWNWPNHLKFVTHSILLHTDSYVGNEGIYIVFALKAVNVTHLHVVNRSANTVN